MDPVRDRVFGLLADLCGPRSGVSAESLRLTSHTLLGLAREGDSDALLEVADALPWLAALIAMTEQDASPELAADILRARGSARALTPELIARRLRRATRDEAASIQRTPPGDARLARQSHALRELARLDRSLVTLAVRSDHEIRATLIEDARLLAAAAEICEGPTPTEVSSRLAELFPIWRDGKWSRSLAVLADLENTWDGGELRRLQNLSERARRFELSGCDHLKQHGYAPAVRAALAFGGYGLGSTEDFSERDLREVLRRFEIFEQDRPLEDLAVALAQTRGLCFAHLTGAASLVSLQPWVDYLRSACVELAEARDITLREATSFAHYSLHLVNFCDLVARHRDAANDGVRQALLDVEEELKQFALVGQQEGLSDRQASLSRFEQARWSAEGADDYVVDRVARLKGAWRDSLPGDPEMDRGLPAHIRRVQRELEGAGRWLGHLRTLFANASIRNTRWLEALEPAEILRLVAFAAACARDLPGVDVSGEWVLDFAELDAWLCEDGGRLEILRELLRHLELERLLGATGEASVATCGLTPHVVASTPPTLRIRFVSHAELDALLTLSAQSQGRDEVLHQHIRRRLTHVLATSRTIVGHPVAAREDDGRSDDDFSELAARE